MRGIQWPIISPQTEAVEMGGEEGGRKSYTVATQNGNTMRRKW
jgi:hypothetical protein